MRTSKGSWLPYLAGLIAVALIVSSLAVFAFYFEKQRYLERAQVATANIVQLQAQNLGNLFDKIDVALQSGALFHQHQHFSGPFVASELNDYLQKLESVVTEVTSIRVLDERGIVRYGHDIPSTQRIDLSDREYFRRARDDAQFSDRIIVDGPLFARISQKWVIVFARRLSKPDGSFAGVIYANLATTQVDKLLSSVALGPHGAATVRTSDFALVHRVPDTKNAVGSKNVSAELRDVISAHPEGGAYTAATALDGITRSNAYRKIADYPFYVIVGLATEDYLGSSQQNLFIIVGLAVLTILAAGVATYQAYRSHQQVISDLRERNELNDSLARKAREAAAASVAKSTFLANMSHELRTPLHQIHGLAHLISRDPLSERQADRLKSLVSTAQNMTTLVDAVLELTKIESGSLTLSETPLDIRQIVQQSVDEFQDDAAKKQIALMVGDIPARDGLLGDATHIRQALMNYLSNAVRFTQTGSIEISATAMQENASSLIVRFAVTDTGPGIKADDLPRLFQIFEQVDSSTTRHHGGLGIGLAATRKIAEALGGEAGCESVAGQGSTFWFSVRLKKSGSATV